MSGAGRADAGRNFEGQRCVVFGVGRFGGGAGAVRFLLDRGAERVIATDRADARSLARTLERFDREARLEWVLGEHREADFEGANWVVVNPAVPIEHPLLQRAREHGARVTTEVALFLEESPARLLGVTGTQGKTSVVTLAGQLLAAQGYPVHVGGNLGGSLLEALPGLTPEHWCVLELSSYQLEALPSDAPRALEAALLTQLLPDHLERHGSPENYRRAKERLFDLLRPEGRALLPDVPDAPFPAREWRCPEDARRCAVPQPDAEGRVRVGERDLGQVPAALPDFQQRNAAAAAALVAAGLERAGRPQGGALLSAELALRTPEHRLQPLGEIAGREVVDNAVSSTPDSTLGALEGWGRGGWLLVGGHDKGLELGPLIERVRALELRLVAFGAAAERVARTASEQGLPVARAADLPDALRAVWSAPLEADPRDRRVLLSPAFSSFDAYDNFQARADHFRSLLDRPEALSKL
ncbi:MAG: UDP-N-acetylmuramoyl-L-alanine--D-glutamate ligase [Planctomycetota bacterium]|jgi:UDP-N-acetylmuramoylalanine--D-glutamate ligase